MGSILMEPQDLAIYSDGRNPLLNNLTTICTSFTNIHSPGIFFNANPLDFPSPLLLLQLSLCASTILFFSRLLRPLGQPLIVSQILGGIVLGSSVLGQIKTFKKWVFPLKGFILLDLVSSLGFMFYFFLLGVQFDLWIVKKLDKRTFAVGFSAVALPLLLGTVCSLGLMHFVDSNFAKMLPLIAGAESVLAFPMVAYFLTELNLVNSEFGRVALSSSTVAGICSFCILTLSVVFNQPNGGRNGALLMVSAAIIVVAFIVFVLRPAILWMIKHNPAGQPLKENYVITLLLGVLMSGFCSQAAGLHIYFGPFILGVLIPAGPPVGSALVERLEFITSWLFMPIFFVKIGLVIDVFTIKLKTFLVVALLALVGAISKFLGAFLSSLYCKLPVKDAISLGLILNSQGPVELGIFKVMKTTKVIDNEVFAVMCLSMLFMIMIITPIIRRLYDPSRKYIVHKRRTVMHSRAESDLRVLVCIHDQEDVPVAINLLEALNPTRRSHLVVYALHLVELVGRANPLLIHHKLSKARSSSSKRFDHIVNAFRYFEQSNNDLVAVHPFTAVSPCATMHDDVCMLSLERKTSLVLLPFHRTFHSNGVMSSCKSNIKMINNNILDKVPCSVGIIVDRGLLEGSRPITSNWSSFRVAVVFLGGPDDREAMFIGARMAGHPNVNLTIIRLMPNGYVVGDDVEERRLDNEAVDEFRDSMTGNYRVTYVEKSEIDGTGTVSVLCSMGNEFELVMVGRRHSLTSPLIEGLVLWHEHTELGAMGEVLASSEFLGNGLILVVQQHTLVESEEPETLQDTTIFMDKYMGEDDDEDTPIQGRT